MQITLMCPGAISGQAAFPAELIEGIPTPERRYQIIDGTITLSGFSDSVLHHDAEELLKNGLYRMPTPTEQDEMAQAAQQASMVQEEAILIASTEDTPIDPPALSNDKKKASGG